jgi:CxxC-x17-CxxC domain-containing protein
MEFRKAQYAKRSYRNPRNDGNKKGELSSRRGGPRYNRDSRSAGSRFSRNDRDSRFNRGSEDNQPGRMYEATCGDCGIRCDIPFKPKYDRPVYCRDCFQDYKPQERSSSSRFGRNDGGPRYNRNSRSAGSRFSRNDRDSRFNRGSEDNRLGEMHKVTCGDCGNECQIPFKPKYDRPVYCRDCFKNHKPQKRSDSGFSRYDRDRTPIHSRDNFRKHEYQKKTTDYNSNLRPKLFDILGKKECIICGFDDERALGFGHDDAKSFNFVQRENIPSSWGKYVSEPELAKEKLQIICLNCNQIKQKEFND